VYECVCQSVQVLVAIGVVIVLVLVGVAIRRLVRLSKTTLSTVAFSEYFKCFVLNAVRDELS
jgi:hypothetical protein